MEPRTLVLEKDDPGEPGVLLRRYVKVGVCWDPTIGGWAWFPMTATGDRARPAAGPFEAAEAALDAAMDEMGGRWELDAGA